MTDNAKLANFVQPPLSEGRLAAQWSRILAREPQQVSPWRRYALMTTASCVGLSLIFVLGGYWGSSNTSAIPVVIERGLVGDPTISIAPGVVATVAKESSTNMLVVRCNCPDQVALAEAIPCEEPVIEGEDVGKE